ncbi:AAA family ATPase [Novosphingobium mangrovi (ex Huang et al. 2023)]|uniref:Pilus assembly protein CpaE n=1 Tax=Novosphingobium mangrovi (ex Huang et al. 2023) TaxID=2976432 RepID=A0ABT2I5G9_9SPHN|nr:pilus assembly protein CpaE [Novosphingobium mangrovi (ex Huang et al. 2023)]MCT2400064.1 pilus assembly protein CpaE [Novosphingobium mangrovi (ex Huang et al. 2023)]
MGKEDILSTFGKDGELRLPAGLVIVGSKARLDELRSAPMHALVRGAKLVELPADMPVPDEVLSECALLVLETDPHVPASLHRAASIRGRRPDLPQILALADANLSVVKTLLKQGISDVIALPFDPEELVQAALGAGVPQRRADDRKSSKAPVIAVVRAIAGNGATSVVTHLAHELGKNDPAGRGACIFDLDVQYGTVGDVLGLSPRQGLGDLLASPDRMDADLVRSVATRHSDTLSVITAPREIQPIEQIDADDLLMAIEYARLQYSYVLLDLPSNWTSWNLSTVVSADHVVMVVELTVASLRQAKRRLELFATAGVKNRNISIVVNRLEKKLFKTIDLDDVDRTLNRRVLGGIHLDKDILPLAQDQGLLADEMHKKSRFAKEVADLAQALSDILVAGDAS